MGWLDASEYFFMEVVARDRTDDSRSTVDITSDDDAGAAAPRLSTLDGAWCPCGVWAHHECS